MKNIISSDSQNLRIGTTQTGHHYWVGKCSGEEYYAGQTFKTSATGNLKSISILPEVIVGETDATLTVYEFDKSQHSFKDKKAECRLLLRKDNEKQWARFDLNMPVESNKDYAFKISCNHDGMMAVAECTWNVEDPYTDGEEWIGSSKNPNGTFHQHFDLAFVAEVVRKVRIS